ncbi:MAG: DNA recombination protein RmuC [Patescibacteria group bacterium]
MDTTIFLVMIIVLQGVLIYLLITRTGNQQNDEQSARLKTLEDSLNRVGTTIREENSLNRKESRENEKNVRQEINQAIKGYGDSMDKRLYQISSMVERQLVGMQKDNADKLEKMRLTVDEKLHATLEKRLGDSFKIVSERLELVHKGLGEMQNLASGVGDLKKVLTNVKTRGTWGEVQLKNLLEQILTPEQYEENVATAHGSRDRVEFAIKLPGKSEKMEQVWIPIDAKFPIEDYQRLVTAQEQADLPEVEVAVKALETRVKNMAKDISQKYVDPPHTTDFAILYVPVEGLYAEITQRRGLPELLQKQYRVMVCGPNTIAALLNSLQMGFRTLAIEKRSSDVWELLGSIKTEFGKFGDLLDKTKKKLQEASNTIDTAASKSRTIERRLNKVQALPEGETTPDMTKISHEQLLIESDS